MLNGSFAVPTKLIKKWEWENTWLIYAFFGMFIFPLLVTVLYLPDIFHIYSAVEPLQLFTVFLFGCGWGVGSLLFGLALKLVGISVGFTVVVGGIAVFGALLPFLMNSDRSLFEGEGIFVLVSLVSTVIGVIFCGIASKRRDLERSTGDTTKNIQGNFKAGLLLCVVAALLSSMLNLAFYFGSPVADAAQKYLGGRSTPFLVNHAVWVITLGAGFIPYLIYCLYLMARNKTFNRYKAANAPINWVYAALMAVLWFLCIICYGIGTEKLGATGASLGWLILMAVTVIVGNVWGTLTNEWKGTSVGVRKLMLIGILFLMGNIFIIGLPKIMGW
jgi:L-rhamnose-H+ transport protein